ncbi:MAG TPA: nucleotide-binding protein [Methanoregulaceae archaeon]|nr:nucleotide-binding protein [Methanoregulaceae archaeon]
MDLSIIAARISQKIQTRGKNVEQHEIEAKLRLLVDEFGVPPAEAERTVISELGREYQVQGLAGIVESDRHPIAELVPEEWVTVEGKVVSLSTPNSPSIAQTGIIADASGAIRFVVWAKAGAPHLEAGRWYRIESAVVDEFRKAPSLKVHSGTTITPLGTDEALLPTVTPVAGLKPGVGSVRVKMVQEWEARSDRILQTGLVGDETGTIKFTIWKEEGRDPLVPGTVYDIYYATVDEFNGRLSLVLNSGTIVPDEEAVLEVGTGGQVYSGAVVHVGQGSGLVKRCPVEGCNRVLSRQNYCPIHEFQPQFRYDLRIKAVLDDGVSTKNILMQRETTESVCGIPLDEAVGIAENSPLGMDEVFLRVQSAVMGRYLDCQGREMDTTVLVTSAERRRFDPVALAALIDRAGGEA